MTRSRAALLVSTTLGGLTGGNLGSPRGKRRNGTGGGALLLVCAFLGWFASLARGRMPKGLRDAGAYAIGYTAQATAYFLLVTDRLIDESALVARGNNQLQGPARGCS